MTALTEFSLRRSFSADCRPWLPPPLKPAHSDASISAGLDHRAFLTGNSSLTKVLHESRSGASRAASPQDQETTMNIEALRAFLAWCTAINLGLLILSSIVLVLCRDPISRWHRKLFGLDEAFLQRTYFRYLADYKIAILVFNLIPYLALRIMA